MHTFYHIPGVAASQTRAQLLHLSMLGQHLWACSGNERAKGQAARVHPWSRGQWGRGQAGKAKGYAGLRCILKWHQLQIPLAEFCVSPITAHKIAL